jgi:hypothetical protein
MLKTLVLIAATLLPQQAAFSPRGTEASKVAGSCTGLPTYQLQLKASTLTAGTVTTWTDPVSGIVATMQGTGPTAGTSDPDPKGNKTVVFTGSQYARLSSTISATSAVSVFAVYKINTAGKNVFTGDYNGGGATYFAGGAGSGAQGLDAGGQFNIGNGSNSSPPSTWQSSGVVYSSGVSYTFYRSGSTDGTGSYTGTFSGVIDTVFAGYSGSTPLQVTLAELDVMNTAITPTQAAAIHACAVSTYGVP